MDKYCTSCDINRYMKPGLESILPSDNKIQYSFQQQINPEVSFKENNFNYSIDFLPYFVNVEGKVVQFLPHYDMPLRDWVRGLIKYGETEGTHQIFIKQQPADETAETVRHELNHSFNLGDSEERVTNTSYTESYNL